MMIVIGFPITSSAVYPNIRSAARFHVVMIPLRSLLTIASSDDSTIAARRTAASGRLVTRSDSSASAMAELPTGAPLAPCIRGGRDALHRCLDARRAVLGDRVVVR